MLLGGVQVPADVLDAHEAGRLVIFTGAGISMGPPSTLPSFAGLAAKVAQKLQVDANPEDPKFATPLDAFMGELNERDGVDVHQLVQRIVTSPTSRPNPNHEALARIAAIGKVRVVSTNYDLHLETALRQHVDDLDVYQAPALPLGDDFEGLVYLHGSAAAAARRLVVTDRDFSGAYFHSAWASRFLERMFREYTVLFVGYSHTDVVMKYLGLGVGPKSQRYVLTDQPDDPLWTRLRVKPLDYPHKQYDVLTACLTQWADHGDMGLLAHRQRVRDLVSTASTPTPDELSYLQDSIRRPDRVKFFCEFARDGFWLDWVQNEEPFTRLFDPTAPADDISWLLARWFALNFAFAEEGLSDKAWAAVAAGGGLLGRRLWDALAWGVVAPDTDRTDHVLRWLWLLMDQEHASSDGSRGPGVAESLGVALGLDEVWADADLRLALLAYLMGPRLTSGRMLGSARLEVATRGDVDSLDTVWRSRFVPELTTLAPVVFPVVEFALCQNLSLERRTSRWSAFNRHRSAIQLHTQDRYRDPIDAVIDAVRDSAIALWDTQPDALQLIVDRWMNSGHVLMRRLAVHVVATSPGWGTRERVRFVLTHNLTSKAELSQEVFNLLGEAVKDAEPALVDEVVDAYMPTTDETSDEVHAFAALEWLERSGVANEKLATALTALRLSLGEVETADEPGLRNWMEVGWVGSNPPMGVNDFDQRVRDSAPDAVTFVLSFEDRTFSRTNQPTREDAVSMVRDTVEQRPRVGLDLWPHIAGHVDLRHAVISGWGHATEPADLDDIINVLVETDLAEVLSPLGQFLLHAERSKAAAWENVAALDTFMDRVWDACETTDVFEHEDGRDWYSETINAPAGLLMEFWFEIFRRRWIAAGDERDVLPEADRAFLERVLADKTRRGAYALTEAAGRLHFLDAADATWCREHLLPLRTWDDAPVAEPFWWGLLSTARWNSGLVEAGLLSGLIDTARHLHRFDEDQLRRWASMLASIAARCESPSAETWVEELTAIAGAADRARWVEAIGVELKDLDEVGREGVWDGWLAQYWERRVASDPRALVSAEADALAAAALFVPGDRFGTAVALVLATSAGLDSHASLARELPDNLIDREPQLVGTFLTHLMRNTKKPFWGDYVLRPKLVRLVEHEGDWKDLRDAALALDMTLP